MKKGKQPHPLTKPVYLTAKIVILSVFGIVAIGILLFFLEQQYALLIARQPKPPVTIHGPPMPTSPPIVSPTPTVKTYISQNLGVSFSYEYPSDPGAPDRHFPLNVKEVDNKIYLYQGSFSPGGLYVQVLSKDPADTLEVAARKQFLQGYSDQKCLFRDNSRNTPHLPSSFIRLSVYPVDSNQEQDGVETTDCPAYLIGQDGGSYFLMDPSHPNKFLFFHIIQGNYISDKGSWDESLRFLN